MLLSKFKLKYQNNKDLFSITILSGVSNLIKIITAFITGKAIAIYTGTNGMAMIGQLQSYINLILQISTGATSNGITKYVAQFHKTEAEKSNLIIRAGTTILVCCSLIVALVNLIFCVQLAQMLLNDATYFYVFLVLGFTIILFAYNNLVLAVLNGLGLYKRLISVNIFTNILSMVFTAALSYLFGLTGALITLATSQSVVFGYTFFAVRKEDFIQYIKPVFKTDTKNVRLLVMFSLMAITAAVVVPSSQLFIRNYIIETHSTHQAGLWEALNRVSGLILAFVVVPLNTYYLPKISATENFLDIKREVIKISSLLSVVLIALLVGVYFMREFLIRLQFTDEFLPMKDLFAVQFVGDYIKILSWILNIILLAKAKTIIYIINETFTAFLHCALCVYFINRMGSASGAQVAYATTYFISLLFLAMYFYLAYKRRANVVKI